MRNLIIILLAALLLTACSFETYQCPSYGNTNHMTKHGSKAQAKYMKKRI